MPPMFLTGGEIALLWEVRRSDEDHGGLAYEELDESEHEAMQKLCDLHLVEALSEYGEAPDGEEDERDAGATALVYRVTALGVDRLKDEPPPGEDD